MAHTSNVYILDHQESSISSHRSRTAANSVAYLLNFVQPHMHILDVGCGPGSITVDLAAMLSQGNVTGIEIGLDILAQARTLASERGLSNVLFEEGDVSDLKYPEDTFDITHAHQVLQHLSDPAQALREMRRVTKPGGIVACREGEMGSSMAFPDTEGVLKTSDLFVKTAKNHGSSPDAGRKLVAYAVEAGFERSNVAVTASTYCVSSREEKRLWGNMWTDRLLNSSLGVHALEGGLTTQQELERYADDWQKWAVQDDAIWANLNVEILCRVT